ESSSPAASGQNRASRLSSNSPFSLEVQTGRLANVPAEEVAHEPHDHVPFAFQREVAGIKQVELDRLEFSLVGFGPSRRKDLVVLAPDNQHRWLVLPEVLLPLRIERRVTPVAEKQVKLDFVIAFAIQQILVCGPAVRRDEFGMRDAVNVLPV